jgi:serine protease
VARHADVGPDCALTNNGIGIASVGRTVRVLPVRALGKCGGFDSDIVAAIRWSAGLSVAGVPANPNPARVISMSLGGEGTCPQPYINAIA